MGSRRGGEPRSSSGRGEPASGVGSVIVGVLPSEQQNAAAVPDFYDTQRHS
ncbi:hypothetical protein GFS60_06610 (plasmid) [Rhodococcus sp. WAY2]|nr:hypothetical protein GFS60_06610 [Rhodococcus sp. WAY2]